MRSQCVETGSVAVVVLIVVTRTTAAWPQSSDGVGVLAV